MCTIAAWIFSKGVIAFMEGDYNLILYPFQLPWFQEAFESLESIVLGTALFAIQAASELPLDVHPSKVSQNVILAFTKLDAYPSILPQCQSI